MGNLPLVSIIVPIYNVEKYLTQCVDSILSQTYKNIEVILVDDGSKDNCPQICDEYAARDNRVHVIHKENEGLISARADGIKHAKGEFVQFVDGDDWISLEILELMMNMMMQYQVQCVICGHYKVGEGFEYSEEQFIKEGYYAEDNYKKKILPNLFQMEESFIFGVAPSVWAKLFKRTELMKYILEVPQSISLGEDVAITYPYLLNACNSIYIMNQPLYYYRQNLDSMTNAYNKVQTKNTIVLLEYLRNMEKNSVVDFEQQLDYYTMAVSLRNFSNEKKGGGKQIFRRYCALKEFVNKTHLKECIKRTDLTVLNRKSRMQFGLILYGGGFILFIAMILQYKFKK